MHSSLGPIPDDLARRLLELSGQPAAKAKRATKAPELVVPRFQPPGTWTIPLATVNESNARDWRSRNRRAGAAWKAVRRSIWLGDLWMFEDAARAGKAIAGHFVRLGGRRLDPLVGLSAALKGAEDCICFLLNIDDGSPLWRPSCDQEPGPGPMGVRVELRMVKGEE